MAACPLPTIGGAINDCVAHLDSAADDGIGFLFCHFDVQGFLWVLDQAIAFYQLPIDLRINQVRRIMADCLVRFDSQRSVQQVMDWYAWVMHDVPGIGMIPAAPVMDSRMAA